jgi:serine/threonine protein kinase
VARFQREAKLLASLNHPNIAALYGLEESGGINFLVLELVEGETLADQIKRGPNKQQKTRLYDLSARPHSVSLICR